MITSDLLPAEWPSEHGDDVVANYKALVENIAAAYTNRFSRGPDGGGSACTLTNGVAITSKGRESYVEIVSALAPKVEGLFAPFWHMSPRLAVELWVHRLEAYTGKYIYWRIEPEFVARKVKIFDEGWEVLTSADLYGIYSRFLVSDNAPYIETAAA